MSRKPVVKKKKVAKKVPAKKINKVSRSTTKSKKKRVVPKKRATKVSPVPGLKKKMSEASSVKKSKRTSFDLPIKMKNDLQKAVVNDGYGLNGKSRWMNDAVVAFLDDRSWKEQLIEGDIHRSHDGKEQVHLTTDTQSRIATAIAEVELFIRTEDRGIRYDISQSSIIRVAIANRLHGLYMPPEQEITMQMEF